MARWTSDLRCDPLTYASVVGVLGTIAPLAGYLPARRDMRVDPIIALRQK